MSVVENLSQERRITFCLYEYWEKLAGENELPALREMNREDIEPFKKNLTLIDLRNGRDQPTFQVVGHNLQEDLDSDLTSMPVSSVPRRTMLSRITDHYQEVLANRVPIAFEAEFSNRDGEKALYRGILLPFSDDKKNINFILGGVRWILEKDVTLDDTKPTIEELMRSIADGRKGRPKVAEKETADEELVAEVEVDDIALTTENAIQEERAPSDEISEDVSEPVAEENAEAEEFSAEEDTFPEDEFHMEEPSFDHKPTIEELLAENPDEDFEAVGENTPFDPEAAVDEEDSVLELSEAAPEISEDGEELITETSDFEIPADEPEEVEIASDDPVDTIEIEDDPVSASETVEPLLEETNVSEDEVVDVPVEEGTESSGESLGLSEENIELSKEDLELSEEDVLELTEEEPVSVDIDETASEKSEEEKPEEKAALSGNVFAGIMNISEPVEKSLVRKDFVPEEQAVEEQPEAVTDYSSEGEVTESAAPEENLTEEFEETDQDDKDLQASLDQEIAEEEAVPTETELTLPEEDLELQDAPSDEETELELLEEEIETSEPAEISEAVTLVDLIDDNDPASEETSFSDLIEEELVEPSDQIEGHEEESADLEAEEAIEETVVETGEDVSEVMVEEDTAAEEPLTDNIHDDIHIEVSYGKVEDTNEVADTNEVDLSSEDPEVESVEKDVEAEVQPEDEDHEPVDQTAEAEIHDISSSDDDDDLSIEELMQSIISERNFAPSHDEPRETKDDNEKAIIKDEDIAAPSAEVEDIAEIESAEPEEAASVSDEIDDKTDDKIEQDSAIELAAPEQPHDDPEPALQPDDHVEPEDIIELETGDAPESIAEFDQPVDQPIEEEETSAEVEPVEENEKKDYSIEFSIGDDETGSDDKTDPEDAFDVDVASTSEESPAISDDEIILEEEEPAEEPSELESDVILQEDTETSPIILTDDPVDVTDEVDSGKNEEPLVAEKDSLTATLDEAVATPTPAEPATEAKQKKKGSVIERAMAMMSPSFGRKTVEPAEVFGQEPEPSIGAVESVPEQDQQVGQVEIEEEIHAPTPTEETETADDSVPDVDAELDQDFDIQTTDTPEEPIQEISTDTDEDPDIEGEEEILEDILVVSETETETPDVETDEIESNDIAVTEDPQVAVDADLEFSDDDILVDDGDTASFEDEILEELTSIEETAEEPTKNDAEELETTSEEPQEEEPAAVEDGSAVIEDIEPVSDIGLELTDTKEAEPQEKKNEEEQSAEPLEDAAQTDDAPSASELRSTLKQVVGYIKKEDANHNRSRDSLYNILTAIYEFHRNCEKSPEAYEEIVEEAGLKIQSRAPYTPVLKICLGVDYDKTRLTEYAAALGIAQYMDVEVDEFHDFIKNFPGGIKGCVKEMRIIRKHGASGNVLAQKTKSVEEARAALRELTPIARFRLKKVIVGNNVDEFCLLLAKRDGHDINVLKIIDDKHTKLDPIIKRAAFIKGNLHDRK